MKYDILMDNLLILTTGNSSGFLH